MDWGLLLELGTKSNYLSVSETPQRYTMRCLPLARTQAQRRQRELSGSYTVSSALVHGTSNVQRTLLPFVRVRHFELIRNVFEVTSYLSNGTCFLQCFDAIGWVAWPVKIVPEMTYKVSSGTLSFYIHTLKWDVCLFVSRPV